jgi:hypothetical protein
MNHDYIIDITMSDLLSGRVTLDKFRGIAFVGGMICYVMLWCPSTHPSSP